MERASKEVSPHGDAQIEEGHEAGAPSGFGPSDQRMLEQYRPAFEFGGVPQALITADGYYLDVSLTMATLLGFERAEVVGRHYKEFTHPDDRGLTDWIPSTVQVGGVAKVEKRFLSKRG